MDGASFGQRLERSTAENERIKNEVKQLLIQRQIFKNQERDCKNVQVERESPGAKSKLGDLVVVKEAGSTLTETAPST